MKHGTGRKALGRVHGRSGMAIVGEAGGEVVVSRSALRSGIGIGGKAASALAGIGVPGYQVGAVRDFSGVHGRKGLEGAYGSQSYREAGGSCISKRAGKTTSRYDGVLASTL